jgi:hypothetical protein
MAVEERAAQQSKRRRPIGSLIVAIVCVAIAIGLLIFVPASPINSSHASQVTTPGAVTLPPTAVPPTATRTR